MELPKSWPMAVKFLCEEQMKLERLRVLAGGVQMDTESLEIVCMQYASTGVWPALSDIDRKCILQRFAWARYLASTLAHRGRKADGTETVSIAYPAWEFEDMMIWFLIEIWGLTAQVSKILESFPPQIHTRPEPPPSLN